MKRACSTLKRAPLRAPLLRSEAIGPGLRRRSSKREAENQQYEINKAAHFLLFPQCQVPGCTRSIRRGDRIDLHHAAGRHGPLLYCAKYFRSACRPHHNRVKGDEAWAVSVGFMVRVSAQEVRDLRNAEMMASEGPTQVRCEREPESLTLRTIT